MSRNYWISIENRNSCIVVAERYIVVYNSRNEEVLMFINHLIIGTDDVKLTSEFYINLFGFQDSGTFVDTGTGGTGQILHFEHNSKNLDFMIVPFSKSRLPNPQHIALEIDSKIKFNQLFEKAKKMNLFIRAEPALTSKNEGIGRLDINGKSWDIFYVLDPGGVNVEIMSLR